MRTERHQAGRQKMRKHYAYICATALAALPAARPALAADPVKIGVLQPLSGNSANAGKSALDAISLAAELVNTVHPELAALPSVGKGGLSNLGGAKIEIVSADHQGNPAEGQAQTLRPLTQQHVARVRRPYH